jgi:hypothetical protein
MSGPKKMMVNLLFVGLFAVVALLAYTYVGVFGLILSLDIVLDHFIPGYSVGILGGLFAGIIVGVICALSLLALRQAFHLKATHIHVLLGVAVTIFGEWVIFPWPPSHILRLVAGDLTYVFTVWAVSWALFAALTSRSRPTPVAQP